jgi:hypothetical protein
VIVTTGAMGVGGSSRTSVSSDDDPESAIANWIVLLSPLPPCTSSCSLDDSLPSSLSSSLGAKYPARSTSSRPRPFLSDSI